MKYAEFAALCQREWMQEDHRGDVCALDLTEDSRRELTLDALAEPGLWVEISEDAQEGTIAVGALLTELSNPVTRTIVKVGASAFSDLYQVSRVVPYAILAPPD